MDRGHQAQGPAQAAPTDGGVGPGASWRHHRTIHRRHRRSGGAERTVQPLLATDHPLKPGQQHRLSLLPPRPRTVLGAGAAAGQDDE